MPNLVMKHFNFLLLVLLLVCALSPAIAQPQGIHRHIKTHDEVETKLNLFPVPAQDVLNVTYESVAQQTVQVQVMNISGKLVYNNAHSLQEGENEFTIPTRNFSNGSYLIRIEDGDEIEIRRFKISH